MTELRLNLALLRDKHGGSIPKPVMVPVTVSYQAKEGVAQAWDGAKGEKLVAELQGARIEWIGVGGIRIIGMEPADLNGLKFRLQEWHLSSPR